MYLINKPNTPTNPSRHKPRALLGLLVLACSVFITPAAEAAKPVVVIGKILPVNEKTSVTLNGSASSDKDGDKLTYKWEQINIKSGTTPVVIANATAATASFVAPAIAKTTKVTLPVTLTFQLSVSDATATTKKTVLVKVNPVNQLPVANAGPNQTVTWTSAGTGVALDASKSTDDGQIISYKWVLLTKTAQLPKGAKFKLTSATAAKSSFTLTSPDQSKPVTLEFQVQVTDNDKKLVKDTVSITVQQILPPVANAGSDLSAISEATVNLSGAGSTGTITSFLWQQTAGPTVVLSSTNAAATSFAAPTVSTSTPLTFELTTTNSAGATKDTVVVTVNPKPVALPVANAGPDQTVASGAVVNLSGSLSTGVITGYAWKQTVGDAVLLTGANTVAASFTAPTASLASQLIFELTATNSAGSVKDTVIINVNAAAPTLDATLSLPIGVIDINDVTTAVISNIKGGAAPYSVTYVWGDGQTTGPIQLADGVVTNTGEHYFAANGSKTVKVTLTDANNASRDFTGTFSVSDVEECK
ncbi:MAG: hypothetical protein NTV43_15985 [Methylococcales bacterium]|nr:hypothetical protein [Methylococcales bacterium]